MKYTILTLVARGLLARHVDECRTLREARSYAYQRARQFGGRPVWCGASAWFEHPDAPALRPVGGYDPDPESGNAAVIRVPDDAVA